MVVVACLHFVGVGRGFSSTMPQTTMTSRNGTPYELAAPSLQRGFLLFGAPPPSPEGTTVSVSP